MKTTVIMLASLLVVFVPSETEACASNSGRSVGMAGAYTLAARGVEATLWNPANLGFSEGRGLSVTILSVGISLYNNSLTLDQYNQYNGKSLTAEDKKTILNSVPSEGLNAAMEADLLGLGVSYETFAFTVSGRGTSDLMLPKDPIETLFFGNEINDTVLLSDSEGEAFASVDLGLSYGGLIWMKGEKEILWGISGRYIRGLIYQEVTESRGEIFTLETGINGSGHFAVRSAHGGKGYGLDLGLNFKRSQRWSFGLCFANVINRIRWDRDTEERGYTVVIDSLLAEDFDTDSLVIDESYTKPISPFSTRIPTVMRAGVAYQGKRTLLTFDLETGFGEGMGVSKKLRVSGGAEYTLSRLLDVRGGVSIGGNQGITVASGVGFKLGRYSLDAGIALKKGLWPTKSKGISLAISNSFEL